MSWSNPEFDASTASDHTDIVVRHVVPRRDHRERNDPCTRTWGVGRFISMELMGLKERFSLRSGSHCPLQFPFEVPDHSLFELFD